MKIVIIRRGWLWLGLWGVIFFLGLYFSGCPFIQSTLAPHKMEVAIVIDDFGGRARGINEMMALPYPLTFAVMPFEDFSRQQAEQASQKGFEIIVHMPFQAVQADPRWYGKKYIAMSSSATQIRQLIDESFKILPMASGLSNHMGSKATADIKVMEVVFKELMRLNRFFLDSKTTFEVSPASKIATAQHLPFIERNVFLDEKNSANYMRRQLKKLMERAQAKGFAVGIGHVGLTGPTLAVVLRNELPKYQKMGYRFVSLSELVNTFASKKFHKNKNLVIGIDPGHGGIDSGTKWRRILEKDLNLNFSQMLAKELDKRGYTVVLTRNEDRLLTPYAHYTYKNRPYKRDDFRCRLSKLETAGVSFIISIHADWSKLSYHRGPIVFYPIQSPVAQKSAQLIQEQLNQIQPFRKIPKPGAYYLLKEAAVPAILIELGFLSNPEDRKLLQDNSYQNSLISAIANGLEKALQKNYNPDC